MQAYFTMNHRRLIRVEDGSLQYSMGSESLDIDEGGAIIEDEGLMDQQRSSKLEILDMPDQLNELLAAAPTTSIQYTEDGLEEPTLHFEIVLTGPEYGSICPTPSYPGRMRDGWTNLMYEKIYEHFKTCALTFTYNFCKKLNSRKTAAAFWRGHGQCKVADCPVRCTLQIDERPLEGEDVLVAVAIAGECSHIATKSNPRILSANRRRLSKKQRLDMAEKIITQNINVDDVYLSRVADMTDAELEAGNTTFCQTPAVLRQAVHEYKIQQRLHPDVLYELNIQRHSWDVGLMGNHGINGFIHSLSVYPFHVMFYTEQQVLLYIDACSRPQGCVGYMHAAANIIKRLPEKTQSQPYLHCLLLDEMKVPALEWITTKNDYLLLASLLNTFLSDVRKINAGEIAKPGTLVIDFWFSSISATLTAFNEQTLPVYLKFTFELLCGKISVSMMREYTFVVVCSTQTMKALAVSLAKVEKNKHIRQSALKYFNLMRRTTNLADAADVYRNIFIIMCSSGTTRQLFAAFDEINSLESCIDDGTLSADAAAAEVVGDGGDGDGLVLNDVDMCLAGQPEEILRDVSPYKSYFNFALSSVTPEEATSAISNDQYSPTAFKCINDMIHLYPFWSCALQGDIARHHMHNAVAQQNMLPTNILNVDGVESYMRTLRRGNSTKYLYRAGDFLNEELRGILQKTR